MKEDLWGIRNESGHIDHTGLVYGAPEECIERFLEDEALFSRVAAQLAHMAGRNGKVHRQGWAGYEAMGYACVRVEIVEQKAAKEAKGGGQ